MEVNWPASSQSIPRFAIHVVLPCWRGGCAGVLSLASFGPFGVSVGPAGALARLLAALVAAGDALGRLPRPLELPGDLSGRLDPPKPRGIPSGVAWPICCALGPAGGLAGVRYGDASIGTGPAPSSSLGSCTDSICGCCPCVAPAAAGRLACGAPSAAPPVPAADAAVAAAAGAADSAWGLSLSCIQVISKFGLSDGRRLPFA